ncbi:meiotic nuclear division protein 1 [Lepidopterella palustris CBS 459.81]|uniref:Meiotic nuclear division protein 1 n=1 Tax=Lepidopterella palustris CBS 459.81 TaxID=1314670 RepID=A0A8E2EEC1_9PEZI|nr:meiotic nuclear division protein 1 [Lepidopterella palustris CBS 459.81]
MAPKTLPPAAKQALILNWFQKSGVAHSLKDLEKALPSVASINGILVKDYLQALSDDNKIRVEKIGSGNWYWSFMSEEKKVRENSLAKAREEHDKAVMMVEELQMKVDEAGAARAEDEDMLLGPGNDRKSLTTKHTELLRELDALRLELAGYSENDPAEVDKKKQETEQYKRDAEKWTEQIQSMEGWFRQQTAGDKGQMANIMRMCYGDQFDEEEECLREL